MFFSFLEFYVLVAKLLIVLTVVCVVRIIFNVSTSQLVIPPGRGCNEFILGRILGAKGFKGRSREGQFKESGLKRGLREICESVELIECFPTRTVDRPVFEA